MKRNVEKSSLGDRMKDFYEAPSLYKLPMRIPVIMRLDGRAFHTLTKELNRPFDDQLIVLMQDTATYLCENITGAVCAYVQSDEISILIHTYKKLDSQAWFGNEVQKMVSISSAMASSFATMRSADVFCVPTPIQFDSRVFVLPEAEVCNYFIWRQQDWERNSIQMLAQSLFTHKECHKKNTKMLKEMCKDKGSNWDKLDSIYKSGTFVVKNTPVYDNKGNLISRGKWCFSSVTPRFDKERDVITKLLATES